MLGSGNQEEDLLQTAQEKTEEQTTFKDESKENEDMKEQIHSQIAVKFCLQSELEGHNVVKEEPQEYSNMQFLICKKYKTDVKQESRTDAHSSQVWEVDAANEDDPHSYSKTEHNFSCEICKESFCSDSEVLNHMHIMHSGVPQENCENDCVQSTSWEQDITSNNDSSDSNFEIFNADSDPPMKSFQCEICSKPFGKKNGLQRHKMIHNNKSHVECSLCGKIFTKKDNLKQHMVTHTGERKYRCEICHKLFNRRSNLKTHKILHTGEKNFKCEICSKLFSKKLYLYRHMITHTGEKNFKCEICSMQFGKKDSLNQHMMTHTGEKNFKCDVCFKLFSKKDHVKRHMLTHTGEKKYRCEICFKLFSGKCNLDRHTVTHVGDKIFKCEICYKLFSRKEYLKRHLFTHTAQNKFTCKILPQNDLE